MNPEIDKDGTKLWYLNGQLHREDGPAVEYPDGTKYCWFLNGLFHRINGPAYEEKNGYKSWWINGQQHRTDGPAIEYPDGTKFWFLKGIYLTKQEWQEKLIFNEVHITTIKER